MLHSAKHDGQIVRGASQNAEPDARAELRRPRTPLIGSVGSFPERYGEELIALALDILGRRPTPPAKFVKHHVITPSNVDYYYSNDALLPPLLVGGPA